MAPLGSRRLRAVPQRLRYYALPDDGRRRVHGESSYQRALHAACGGRVAPFTGEDDCWDRALPGTVMLWPEPSNPYDPHAVRVDVPDFGCVGYLPRSDAARYSAALGELLIRGSVATCPARIVRNRDVGYYAIYLHLADPNRVRDAVLSVPR